MLKTAMLSLAAAFGLGMSAFATAQALQPSRYAPHLAPAPAAPSRPANQRHQVIKPGDRDCIRDTGSLIPAKPGQCLQGAFGRSYSAKELRDTGQPKVGDALRMLDPAIH
ncbi:hypothetical protein [Rhodanobacter geophilus]|uniref:Uncharacterized protein n=1 Tax=Rhodanobacter geophilus TaxID=3162488 RepID=A0ABV3QN65_9GAMM